jgi:osmoprotectant transport system permease protein
VGAASAVALPIGTWLGHSKRGSFLVVSVTNAGRAVPSLGVVFLFFAVLGAGFFNITLALVLLAIPPILTNAYTGVREVEPDIVDAARGIGMTGLEIVRRVELPLALPLVMAGIRISAVNVIATATLGPEGGVVTLGDPIINPTSYGSSGRLGAAIIVAALAVAAEVGLGAVERAVTPKGISRPARRRTFRPRLQTSKGRAQTT